MKRYVRRLDHMNATEEEYMKEVPEINSFLIDIIILCKKHRLTISHENKFSQFEIDDYDMDNIHWLNRAIDIRTEGESDE